MVKLIARLCLPAFFALFLFCEPWTLGAAQSEKPKSSTAAPAKQEPVTWLLAGREGTCAPLSLLEKRGTEFRSVEGPEDLAKRMRGAGHKVEIKEHRLASPPAVEVRVPARGLYVMFVRADLCKRLEGEEPAPAKRKQKSTRGSNGN